jgi:hypothetical protein
MKSSILILLSLLVLNNSLLFGQIKDNSQLERHFRGTFECATFVTADNQTLISATDRFINKWNLKTGEHQQIKLNDEIKGTEVKDMSSKGNYIAYYKYSDRYKTPSKSDTLYIVNTQDGTYKYFKTKCWNAFFSPNGKWLVFSAGSGVFYVVNLDNWSFKKNETWSNCHLNHVSNKYMYYDEYDGKIYYEDLEKLNGWYADKKKLKSSYYGYGGNHDDISRLWCYKATGYVNTTYKVYEVSDDNGKTKIGEQEEIKFLTRDDFSSLSDLVITSRRREKHYSIINKKTGKVFYYDQKLTNSKYFVYNPNSKGKNKKYGITGYRFEIFDITNPEKSFTLLQNIEGDWLVMRDGKFDADPSLFKNKFFASKITQSYIPGLIEENHLSPDLYSKENYKKIRAIKQFLIDSTQYHVYLKEWIAPGLSDDEYKIDFPEFLSKNMSRIHFQGNSWYGGEKKKFKMVDDKIRFALVNTITDKGVQGFYGEEDRFLVWGLLKDSLLIIDLRIYSNGYDEGDFKNLKLHGNGIRHFDDGLILKGEFVDGTIIEGEVKYPKGGHYKGSFKEGLFHGQGEYVYASGTKYVGSFMNGEFHGEGKMFNKNGALFYEGQFAESKYHGKGKEFNPDESPAYDGEYIDGERHGVGIAWVDGNPEKAEYYKGERIDQAYIIRKENEELKANVTPDYVGVWLEVIGRIPATIYLYYPNQKGGKIYSIRSYNEKISVPRNTKIGYKDKIILTATEELNFTTVYNSK